MMPRIRPYIPTAEQEFLKRKFEAVEILAKSAGFDETIFAHTEFCLLPFFELIVEECAKISEIQGRNYSGEYSESKGCFNSANAIRTFGKIIGNETKTR